MPWPTVAVTTTGMDADTDDLPRSDILDLTTKFNDLIAMRGVASGVCDLDASALVPIARIPATIQRQDALLDALAAQTTAANKIQAYSAADTPTLLSTGTASGNVPLVGTESATTTVFGLVRKSTTAENAAGTGTGVVAAADLPTAVTALAPTLPAATASANGYMTSTYASKLDGIAAGATVGVPTDVGVHGVGILVTAQNTYGLPIASGATISGSLLLDIYGGYLPGTWRNVSASAVNTDLTGRFQRIV